MAIPRSRIKRLLATLDKPARDAFLKAVRSAQSRTYLLALIDAIENGIMDDILKAAGVRDGMFTPLTEALRHAYVESATFVLGAEVPKRFGMEFNITNPRAEQFLRDFSSQLITRVRADQIDAVQVILNDGMSRGLGPRQTALDIVGRMGPGGTRTGGVLGMNKQQAEWLVNAAEDLETLNPRYLERKLRDRRWDKIFKKHLESGKPIPKKTQMTMKQRYADRLLKHRGDTIARTEVLRAVNEASDEAMRQVVDEGLAPPNAIKKVWRHSWSRNEREGHVYLNGVKVGLDEYFVNPVTYAAMLYPGDGPASEVINCRCYIEHEIDFAAVERAA